MSVVVGLAMTGVIKLGMGPTSDAVRMVGTPPGEPEPSTTTSTTVAPTGLPGLDVGATFLPWSGQTFDGDWGSIKRSSKHCPLLPANPKLPTVKVLVNPVSIGGIDEPQPYAAVERLVDHFNAGGSICGRGVELVTGTTATKDITAVLGMPLDGKLDDALASGEHEKRGVPVVGGDGLSSVQHQSAIAYPVGTSAAAITRMAAQHGWESGARTFAIVYDATRPLGTEAASALRAYIQRSGGTLKASIGLGSESVEPRKLQEFNDACSNQACDMVLLALLPDTAATWLTANPQSARLGTSALPTLLTTSVADTCFRTSNDRCNGLTAWSGFIAPFGRHAYNGEAAFAWSPAAAYSQAKGSAMVEAAVIGTRVLLEALVEAGPQVTRSSLRSTLDNFVFTSDVASPLSWPRGTPRIGNHTAQAWRLVLSQAARPEDVDPTVEGARRLDAEAADAAVRQERLPYVPLPSTRELPKREWHEAGTGWRSDPQ